MDRDILVAMHQTGKVPDDILNTQTSPVENIENFCTVRTGQCVTKNNYDIVVMSAEETVHVFTSGAYTEDEARDNAAKIAFQYLAKSEYSNFAVQIQVLENATSTQLSFYSGN